MYYENAAGQTIFKPGGTAISDSDIYLPPCSDEDFIAREDIETLSKEFHCFQRRILEEEKTIKGQLNNISKEISNTIEDCTIYLSKSINDTSERIISYLRQILNESEYNTMLSEYYFLQEKIDQYEDYCIENNLFEKVHKQLELLEQKTYINELSEREVMALVALIGDNFNILTEIMKSRLISPIDAIRLFYAKYNYTSQIPYELIDPSNRTSYNIWSVAEKELLLLECQYKDVYSYPVIISYIDSFQRAIRYCNAKISLYNLKNQYELLRTAVRNHKKAQALSND